VSAQVIDIANTDPVGKLDEYPALPVIPARTATVDGEALADALATPGLRCTTRLIDGEFPRWRALVPSEFATTVVVDRDALAEVVARVAVVAATNTPVRLRIDADAQRIWVQAGSGNDAQGVDETDADVTGEDLAIASTPPTWSPRCVRWPTRGCGSACRRRPSRR
jgi:hypothetical protein